MPYPIPVVAAITSSLTRTYSRTDFSAMVSSAITRTRPRTKPAAIPNHGIRDSSEKVKDFQYIKGNNWNSREGQTTFACKSKNAHRLDWYNNRLRSWDNVRKVILTREKQFKEFLCSFILGILCQIYPDNGICLSRRHCISHKARMGLGQPCISSNTNFQNPFCQQGLQSC